MNDKLNPEVIKAGAEMAWPCVEWTIVDGRTRVVNWFGSVGSKNFKLYWFDPISDDSDANSLMLALMKEGWVPMWIKLSKDTGIWSVKNTGHLIEDESFPLLLLKCVSAMKELPLYV